MDKKKPKDPSSQKLRRANKKTEEQKNKEKELEDLLKRVQADYVNFRKRTDEEKKELLKYASKDTVLKVLPVLDNLDRALKHTPKELENNDWVKGFNHIESQFENILKEEGLEIIETVGKDFDYNQHEAISFEENKEKKEGEILKEFERGYKLNGQVIRPAKVIVVKNSS